MNKEIYAQRLCEKLKQDYFTKENNYEVFTTQVEKNNGLLLTGICIKSRDTNIGPTFYVDDLWDTVSIDEAAEQLASNYYQSLKEANKIKEIIGNDFLFENIKDRICFKVINEGLNREFLNNAPYFDIVGDIKGIFYVQIEKNASIKIKNADLERWHIPKNKASEILYSFARQNTERLNPAVIRPLRDIILELMHNDISADNLIEEMESIPSDKVNMYVLTNDTAFNGASVMFYRDGNLLEEYSKHFNSNLYILPSSTHEVMIVPDNDSMSANDLRSIVREANMTGAVDITSFLSNEIFYYDKERGLSLVDIEPKNIDRSR